MECSQPAPVHIIYGMFWIVSMQFPKMQSQTRLGCTLCLSFSTLLYKHKAQCMVGFTTSFKILYLFQILKSQLSGRAVFINSCACREVKCNWIEAGFKALPSFWDRCPLNPLQHLWGPAFLSSRCKYHSFLQYWLKKLKNFWTHMTTPFSEAFFHAECCWPFIHFSETIFVLPGYG